MLLTTVQGYFIAVGLEGWAATQGMAAVVEPGMLFRIAATVSLVGGTMFLMWIGEQITSRGIGNGVSLIIMAGIVASMPQTLAQLFEGGRTGTMDATVVFGIVIAVVLLVLFICFMERAQRRVLIQYPKRQTARGMMQQERSHLPIKINTAGVIPPIFASSLLLMPLTVLQLAGGNATDPDSASSDWLITVSTYLQHGSPLYLLLYAAGIAFFCFFYTAVQFNSEETAENLKRHGGFIPGIRPGKATEHLFRLSSQPHHRHRRGLSGDDLPDSGDSAKPGGDSLLSGRDQLADRGQCDDGHRQPDPEPLDCAPIWRSDQEGEVQGRAPPLKRGAANGEQFTWISFCWAPRGRGRVLRPSGCSAIAA